MPLVSLLVPGDQGYLGWKVVVGAKEVPYGLFIGEVVNFVIVAFVLYLFIVKFLGFRDEGEGDAPRGSAPSLEGGNAARRDPRPAESPKGLKGAAPSRRRRDFVAIRLRRSAIRYGKIGLRDC